MTAAIDFSKGDYIKLFYEGNYSEARKIAEAKYEGARGKNVYLAADWLQRIIACLREEERRDAEAVDVCNILLNDRETSSIKIITTETCRLKGTILWENVYENGPEESNLSLEKGLEILENIRLSSEADVSRRDQEDKILNTRSRLLWRYAWQIAPFETKNNVDDALNRAKGEIGKEYRHWLIFCDGFIKIFRGNYKDAYSLLENAIYDRDVPANLLVYNLFALSAMIVTKRVERDLQLAYNYAHEAQALIRNKKANILPVPHLKPVFSSYSKDNPVTDPCIILDVIENSLSGNKNKAGIISGMQDVYKQHILSCKSVLERFIDVRREEIISLPRKDIEGVPRFISVPSSIKIEEGKAELKKSEGKKAEYDKIEIDFSDKKEIRIDNKPPIPMRSKKGIRQEFLLLEEALTNRNEIHWSVGFILFKKWQENVPKEGPVEQFRSVVSDLKRVVGINLLIPSNKENVRSWELNKDIHIESTIKKSKVVCKDTNKIDDLLRRAEELKKAFLLYPNSIEASRLLIDLAEKCKDSVTLDMDLENKKTDAVRLIRIREENLKSAITMIKTKGLECEWKGDWQEVSEYLWLMIKECSELEQYKIRGEGILRKIRVDPDEARCQGLISMIILIKGIDKDDRNFLRFIAEPEISDSIKFVSSKLFQKIADRKWPKEDYRDIKDRAMDFLWEGIKHWKHPDLKKTNELKNYLIANISYRLLEWFLEDRCAISIEKQRDLWHLENVRRKLKKKLGSSPSVEEQLKELGPKWDRSRIGAVLSYEGNISGFVDIDKYYEYFDEIEFDLEDILAILEREN